jgi:transcriptional regulator with XRE-family HTH domain
MVIPMEWAQVVGRNIHRLRAVAGLSLAELAKAATMSKTTLHGIEQGHGNPTLSTLWALAAALRVPLGELLESRTPPVEVVRAGEGPWADGDAVHARLLHRIRLHGTVEVYDLRVDEVRQHSAAHLRGVQECLVITHGELSTGPADDPVKLSESESVRFDASRDHVYQARRPDTRAVLLMLHPDTD